MFANRSNNPTALANKEDFLTLLKKLSNELLATMHVSKRASSSGGDTVQKAAVEEGDNIMASSMENKHQLATRLTTAMTQCKQNVDGCVESLVKYNGEAAKGPNVETLRALNTEMVRSGEALNELGQAYVTFKTDNGPGMEEVKEFMSFVIDKSPAFKEGMAIMMEAKERHIQVEEKIVKQMALRVEVTKLESVSTKENAERDIETEKLKMFKMDMEIQRRQSLLKIEQDEFQFAQFKKRTLEENEERAQKKKQKESVPELRPSEEEDFITVRDTAQKYALDIFSGIPLADHADIVKEAGGYASRRYKTMTGKKMLGKTNRYGYQVCKYARGDEEFIITALKWAVAEYKKKRGVTQSSAQATLSSMWASKPSL